MMHYEYGPPTPVIIETAEINGAQVEAGILARRAEFYRNLFLDLDDEGPELLRRTGVEITTAIGETILNQRIVWQSSLLHRARSYPGRLERAVQAGVVLLRPFAPEIGQRTIEFVH